MPFPGFGPTDRLDAATATQSQDDDDDEQDDDEGADSDIHDRCLPALGATNQLGWSHLAVTWRTTGPRAAPRAQRKSRSARRDPVAVEPDGHPRPGSRTVATDSSVAASSTCRLPVSVAGSWLKPISSPSSSGASAERGTNTNSPTVEPAPNVREVVCPVARSWRYTVSSAPSTLERGICVDADRVAVAVRRAGEALVDARELVAAVGERRSSSTLPGGAVERPALERRPTLVGAVEVGGEHLRVAHQVEHDGVAVVVGVERCGTRSRGRPRTTARPRSRRHAAASPTRAT